MRRRDFLRNTFVASVAAGTAASLLKPGEVKASEISVSANLPYDLVAVKGGTPAAMFDKAIESLGGMGKFVKAGQTVVVKPNIGWDKTPEMAANTNPELVGRIVEHCVKAGAKKVFVFDNTCHEWTKCYKNSGIEKAVKDAGGVMVSGKTEDSYKEVSVPKGRKLKSAKVHELIINSDVFINVPILKSHGGAKLTMAMKNHMGIVWDRGWWHNNDLHQCIADFATYRLPDLNVLDAYRVMKQNGPIGVSKDDVVMLGSLLVSKDIVAIDAAGAKLIGKDPSEVDYIGKAHELGIGNQNLDKLRINRLKMS